MWPSGGRIQSQRSSVQIYVCTKLKTNQGGGWLRLELRLGGLVHA